VEIRNRFQLKATCSQQEGDHLAQEWVKVAWTKLLQELLDSLNVWVAVSLVV